MPSLTMIEAIRDAMDVMMARNDRVVTFGQDVGRFGGVFRCTDGLQAKDKTGIGTRDDPHEAFLRQHRQGAAICAERKLPDTDRVALSTSLIR